MSIRRTLLTSLLTGLALVLAIAGAALYYRTRSVLIREFDATLHAEAARIISLTEQDHGRVELDTAGETLPEYFQLRLHDGRTIGHNDPPNQEWRSITVQFVPKPADEELAKPTGPVVTMVVAQNPVALKRTLAGIRAGMLFVGVLVLAATALVVTLTVRRGLAPLDALGTTIESTTLQTRFAAEGELRPVVKRLNDLLARLDEAFQRERRISADIAHELRTPIAELRTLAEVGVKWPEEASFRDALQIAQRMETLVTGLLALARHDAGQQPAAREPVALATLVDEVWQPLADRTRRRQLDVVVEVAGNWQTDPTLLRLIVGNLLANAVEYTPERGKVCVTAGDSRLEVTNSTDNFARDDLPRLFERFWRKDASRTDTGHSGLGLALAKTAAAALGLQLTADMPDATTLRLSLTHRP